MCKDKSLARVSIKIILDIIFYIRNESRKFILSLEILIT